MPVTEEFRRITEPMACLRSVQMITPYQHWPHSEGCTSAASVLHQHLHTLHQPKKTLQLMFIQAQPEPVEMLSMLAPRQKPKIPLKDMIIIEIVYYKLKQTTFCMQCSGNYYKNKKNTVRSN